MRMPRGQCRQLRPGGHVRSGSGAVASPAPVVVGAALVRGINGLGLGERARFSSWCPSIRTDDGDVRIIRRTITQPVRSVKGRAAADRYLNFLDHVSHISWRTCVADRLSDRTARHRRAWCLGMESRRMCCPA
jgi:hypothetical protein